jgi:hypothetical protein
MVSFVLWFVSVCVAGIFLFGFVSWVGFCVKYEALWMTTNVKIHGT